MAAGDKEKILVTGENVDELKAQAFQFLESGYFFAAAQFFNKLSKQEPENKDYHIYYLMADNQVKDEESLIKFYQDLYSKPDYETKIACEKEEEHVDEMAEHSCIPGYLDTKQIYEAYDYDLTYKSCLFSRKDQKEKMIKLIDKNEHLSWLKKRGFREINDILKVYDRRIDEAEIEERSNREQKKNDYQRFLYQTYVKVKDLYQEAKKKKDDDYHDLIAQYEKAEDIEELRQLILSFERFSDYKDGKRYVSLCREKIDSLKELAEQDAMQKTVTDSVADAKSFLVKGYFGEAYDAFAKVISLDQSNEDAHLGILMSQTRTKSEDELFDYYKDLFNDDLKQPIEACEEDERHVNDMVEKFYLKDYLEKETIREKYHFDRTYQSSLDNRMKQSRQIREELEMNPVFQWLLNSGSDRIKDRIRDLYDTYDERVADAKAEDESNAERIRNEYQRFIFNTYAQIKRMHKDANKKKDDEYKDIIRSYRYCERESELRDLIARLQDLEGYKESEKYIGLCEKKIEELKEKQKDAFKLQEIETTLIAGRAYLASGNRQLADKSFEKVLTLDPDNPYAYLGILMIEAGVSDYDQLIEYYGNLFHDDVSELQEGCEEDKDHIDLMADRYYIRDYLDKPMIRRYYTFDRNIESVTASRVTQLEQLEEELKMNPLMSKITARGNEDILEIFSKIRNIYEGRIRQARKDDVKHRDSVYHIYQVYLNETDKTIEKIYEEKKKEAEKDLDERYWANVALFEKDLEIAELEDLLQRFEKDIEYKDCASYVEQCKDRIKKQRLEIERDHLQQLYKQGNENLQGGIYDEAKKCFNEYLSIDPDREDIYLLLLMAETQTESNEELFEYYRQLYHDDVPEIMTACEANDEHIAEICDKCEIPGELEKSEIAEMYEYDRTYESFSSCRQSQEEELKSELHLNPSWVWLTANGSRRVKEQIEELIASYEQRTASAREQDKVNNDTIVREYRSFLKNKDREVRSLYNGIIRERNDEKRRAIKERKELEKKQREDAEKELRAREENERVQRELKERERLAQRQEEEKARIERQAAQKHEKESMKLERAEAQKLKREQKKAEKESRKTGERPQLNLGIIMAVLSLLMLFTVTYIFVLAPELKYRKAIRLADQGDFDQSIVLFEQLGDYKESIYKIKETTYRKADDLYIHGEVITAANMFKELRFDDSEDRVNQIKEKMMKDASVGSIILFGEYEQDGNYDNGKELIEWIVVEEQEGSILVVSRYGLEGQRFDPEGEAAYWQTSSIRSWLNGRFIDNSFANENPSSVLQAILTNYKYPEDADPDDIDDIIPEEYETRDRVFLLSSIDVERLFKDENARICKASAYAIENGVAALSNDACDWWLRSSGRTLGLTNEFVKGSDGSIGESANNVVNAIRPAMWIKR